MGASFGYDTNIPPGGALLYIQRPECFSQPRFSEQKPFCISMVPDATWQTFHNQVAGEASQMWSEKATLAGFLAFPLLIIGMVLPRVVDIQLPALQIIFVLAFIGLIIGPRVIFVNQNEKRDKVIRRACSDFATATGMGVDYRTRFTGVCKPKGSHPFRAIAITPQSPIGAPIMGAISASPVLNVQVPPGSGPGSQLQVQGPSGQLIQVVVPEGVSAGQTFQVQVPPPVETPIVVAATVVTN